MVRTKQNIANIWSLMRLNKPIGNWLLLWPTLTTLWLASHGVPNLRILLLFIGGALIMRACGCIINDIWDKNIDNQVARTKHRPLANNSLSLTIAMILLGILLVAALLIVLELNTLCLYLAIIALILSAIYPSAKRWFVCPQAILGLTFNFGILIAYAAVTNSLPISAWLLYIIGFFWTLLYDTQYALADIHDDNQLQLHSSAIWFGKYNVPIMKILQFVTLILLCTLGYINILSMPYWIGILIVFLLFIYQNRLTQSLNPKQCFKAFLNNHWAWLAIFIGVALQH